MNVTIRPATQMQSVIILLVLLNARATEMCREYITVVMVHIVKRCVHRIVAILSSNLVFETDHHGNAFVQRGSINHQVTDSA